MDEDRLSASSNESDNENDNGPEHDQDVDEVMEDADDAGGDQDDEDDEDDEDNENDHDNDHDADADADADGDADGDADADGDGDGDADGDADADAEGDEADDGTTNANESRSQSQAQSQAAATGGGGTATASSSGTNANKKPAAAGDGSGDDGINKTETGESSGAGAAGGESAAGETTNGAAQDGKTAASPRQASSSAAGGARWPGPSDEMLNARLYDIVPTMAAPQSTSVNAMAITPDLRYWITGGSDGYIRKYDGPGTINGKLALTVAQRHPFVDTVTKAGMLMSYWENEEPAPPGRGDQEHILSPVYSLAVQADALWLLSGLDSGGINLQSVRHDEGKRIACLQQHTSAVSVLTLAQDERSVLSGSWDKNMFDWDLNSGQTVRSFEGSGGQISAIELRPASGAPIPDGADEPVAGVAGGFGSGTMSTNNGLPPAAGGVNDGMTGVELNEASLDAFNPAAGAGGGDESIDQASPAHESLFGGSDAGSLFGETAGDQPFGNDEDEYGGGSMDMMGGDRPGHQEHGAVGDGMDHSADMAMASLEGGGANTGGPETNTETEAKPEPAAAGASGAGGGGDAMDVDAAGSGDGPQSGAEQQQQQQQQQSGPEIKSETEAAAAEAAALKRSQSPSAALLTATDTAPKQHDPTQTSSTTFLSAATDGSLRIWDKRVREPVARIGTRPGVPPWCMGACWSPDGNRIYAGRRNGTVEEYDIHKAKRNWEPERSLRFPAGSGAVSAVRPMPNGRHLVCASHDILRLYDLRESSAFRHSTVPFLIIPGPPRAGVISSLYIDPTSRFMLSAAGTRGWEGTSTEVLIGYEINPTGTN